MKRAFLGRRGFARPGWRNANTAQGLLGARALTANPFGAGRWTRHRAPQSARRTRKRDRKPRPQRKQVKKKKALKPWRLWRGRKLEGISFFAANLIAAIESCKTPRSAAKKQLETRKLFARALSRQGACGKRRQPEQKLPPPARRPELGLLRAKGRIPAEYRQPWAEMARRREALSARARTVSGLSAGGTSRKAALRRPTSANSWTAGEPDTGRAQKQQRGEQAQGTGAKAARGRRAGRPGRREGGRSDGQIRPLAAFLIRGRWIPLFSLFFACRGLYRVRQYAILWSGACKTRQGRSVKRENQENLERNNRQNPHGIRSAAFSSCRPTQGLCSATR